MKNSRKAIGLAAVAAFVLLLNSCNPVEDDSKSSSRLILTNLLGTSAEGTSANYLQSDVQLITGSVRADAATATFTVQTLDPDPLLGTSAYSDIVVNRYTVSFSRTDGKGVAGVDVPYPFEGSLSTRVAVGGTASISFILVREAAKLEPPLIELVDLGSEVILTCIARIDFYGHDLLNNDVQATGYLTVYFANYVDQEQAPPEGGQR